MKTTEVDKKNKYLANLAKDICYNNRAENLIILDMRGLLDYADFFVIASANNVIQTKGLARNLEVELKKVGAKLINTHGKETSWVLLDFGDIIIHIFTPDQREFYQLEHLWGDAKIVS